MSDLRVRPDAAAPPSVPEPPPALRLRRPSWRDRRLLAGLVLVLASTVLGARLLSAETPATPVWVAERDLAAGAVLEAGDLEARAVHVPGSAGRYLDASAPAPTGRVLAAPVLAGELLPASALAPEVAAAGTRTVSVPVEQGRAPGDLRRGELVDVYVTPEGSGSGSTVAVATQVVVAAVEGDDRRFGASGSGGAVQLTVPADDVARLVGGLARGSVDVVRVPSGAAAEATR